MKFMQLLLQIFVILIVALPFTASDESSKVNPSTDAETATKKTCLDDKNGDGECSSPEEDQESSGERLQQQSLMPVGALYKKTLDIFMVGPQDIRLKIIKGNEASIIVKGGVPINDRMKFFADEDGGSSLKITMSENLKGILSKYFVTLSKILYDVGEDSPSVFVEIFGVVSFSVKLERVR